MFSTFRWCLGILAVSWVLHAPLVQANDSAVAKGLFGYPPVQMPMISDQAGIQLGWREGDTKGTIQEDRRSQLIDEINALRARPWTRFDGKASSPVVFFRVLQPGAQPLSFSLTRDGITELRRGGSLTGGGYSLQVDLHGFPGLQRLLDAAMP